MNQLTITKNTDSKLLKKVDSLGNFIGNTPLYPIKNLNPNKNVALFAKLEWQQFGGSVKSRPAYRIIRDALKRGELTNSVRLLDATSGNTGISYAHICSSAGIPLTICLPENASEERKQILSALGAEIRYTSGSGSTDEAQGVAQTLADGNPGFYYYADQYNNESNRSAHYDTTGPEIVRQTNHSITHFIAGLGTTGTFTGTGSYLKDLNPYIKLIGLQPDLPMHGLEGWKHLETAHIPGIYNESLADEIRTVNTENAYRLIKKAALEEGLLLSPSSAANLSGALQLAEELEEGTVVTIFPDNGSRYRDVYKHIFG